MASSSQRIQKKRPPTSSDYCFQGKFPGKKIHDFVVSFQLPGLTNFGHFCFVGFLVDVKKPEHTWTQPGWRRFFLDFGGYLNWKSGGCGVLFLQTFETVEVDTPGYDIYDLRGEVTATWPMGCGVIFSNHCSMDFRPIARHPHVFSNFRCPDCDMQRCQWMCQINPQGGILGVVPWPVWRHWISK